MRYLSVCSGIEAATVAWHPLGWTPVAFSEIDPFPCAVLAHHYPNTPNWGDMERFDEWPDADIDVLVGGTPCQSFSVAGLRRGLDDPRGNLTLIYLGIAERYAPEWVVWENVPGVLSSDGGRAFGAFLGGLEKLGYGWSYRTLDAQYFGLAQRRRRVFVVASDRGWAAAGSVLFEPESLRGDSAPRREAGERVAASLTRGADSSGRGGYAGRRQEDDVNIVPTAHALTGEGFDASEDGTGRGTPLVPSQPVCMATGQSGAEVTEDGAGPTLTCNHEAPIAALPFDTTQVTHESNYSKPKPGDPCHPLQAGAHPPAVAFDARQNDVLQYGDHAGPLNTDGHSQAVAFQGRGSNIDVGGPVSGTLGTNSDRASGGAPMMQSGMSVRRLTPRECERLQGFPDDYTRIPWRNRPAHDCPDGPRYKALGNSMAVPVVAWIGARMERVDEVIEAMDDAVGAS